jgi:hypothetical protein
MGRKVCEEKAALMDNRSGFPVDLGSVVRGIYLLSIELEGVNYTRKIIID